MTMSIQHTLQFLIRPLTARNSISLKSRIMARGACQCEFQRPFETHWRPGVGRLRHLAAASDVVRGVDALDVVHNPASGYRHDKRNSNATVRTWPHDKKRKCAKMEKNDSSATSICLETNTRCTLWDADVTTDPKTCKSIFSQIALGPATVYSPELNSSAGATFNRDAGGCDAQFKFLRGHSGS